VLFGETFMNDQERAQYAVEKAKESAKKLFKEKPKSIQKELEKETVLGNPENLVKPDNKDE